MQEVPNLCVMGGDAANIVEYHLQPKTISHAFINFPEPPSGEGQLFAFGNSHNCSSCCVSHACTGWQGVDDASNSLALLTPSFFRNLHRLLEPCGRLTIFSDNWRYSRALASMVGCLQGSAGAPKLFASVDLDAHNLTFEYIDDIKLYHGIPGPECGHSRHEQSYFDRFWEYRQGEDTERFFLLLARQE